MAASAPPPAPTTSRPGSIRLGWKSLITELGRDRQAGLMGWEQDARVRSAARGVFICLRMRRSGHIVQDRPVRSARWDDTPGCP